MSLTAVTVTARYLDPAGGDCSGTVTFTLTSEMQDATDKEMIPTAPIVGRLDGTGHLSVVIFANDDSTTLPLGTAYTVTEDIIGSSGTPATERVYNVIIPHAASGGTIDLSALSPVTTTPFLNYIVAPTNPTTGQVLQWNGTAWVAGSAETLWQWTLSGAGTDIALAQGTTEPAWTDVAIPGTPSLPVAGTYVWPALGAVKFQVLASTFVDTGAYGVFGVALDGAAAPGLLAVQQAKGGGPTRTIQEATATTMVVPGTPGPHAWRLVARQTGGGTGWFYIGLGDLAGTLIVVASTFIAGS